MSRGNVTKAAELSGDKEERNHQKNKQPKLAANNHRWRPATMRNLIYIVLSAIYKAVFVPSANLINS
jgi:hypothetical protein